MKKVLVVWVWSQWQKYIRYFLKNNYITFWACKTSETQCYVAEKYNIEVTTDYKKFLQNTHVDIVIIALPPELWGSVAHELWMLYEDIKIIVEIPVCWDTDVLHTLVKMKNVFFYTEEYFTALSTFFITSKCTTSDFHVTLKTHQQDYADMFARRVSFVHILNNFLSFHHKINSLNVDVVYHEREDIFYEIDFFHNTIPIKYVFDRKKTLSLSDRVYVDDYNFDKTLGKILDADFDNQFLKASYVENYLYIENNLLD